VPPVIISATADFPPKILGSANSDDPCSKCKSKGKSWFTENQLSVFGGQLSDKGQSVVGSSETGKQTTGKLQSENRKLRTDNDWIPRVGIPCPNLICRFHCRKFPTISLKERGRGLWPNIRVL